MRSSPRFSKLRPQPTSNALEVPDWYDDKPRQRRTIFQDLDQVLRIEELYLLQRVAQRINSILDLETLLDRIVGDVANTFGYNRLAVLLKDDETDELVIAAGWTGKLCLKGTRFKIGQGVGMGAHAAASGETFYAPDVRKIPFYVVGEKDTCSEIDIPLTVRGELIGIFNVQHIEMNAFSPEHPPSRGTCRPCRNGDCKRPNVSARAIGKGANGQRAGRSSRHSIGLVSGEGARGSWL